VERVPRTEAVQRLIAVASGQHGVVTARQVSEAGLSSKSARTLRSQGWLNAIRPGAYLLGSHAPSDWQMAVAAALVAGPGAVLSHMTAARVHRFGHLLFDSTIELSVLVPKQPRLPGVVVHRVPRLAAVDTVEHRGVIVTSPARTVCDLAARMPSALIERVVDEGLVQRLWTTNSVAEATARSRQRPGVRMVKRLLEARQAEAQANSDLQQRAARILRPFEPFELEYQVVMDGHVFVLDIAWPAWKVGVECDGFRPHDLSRSRFDHDRVRGNLLLAGGWAIAHFTSAMSDEQLLIGVGRLLPARISGNYSRRVG
jgi:very-short-patch-repair endonuclease